MSPRTSKLRLPLLLTPLCIPTPRMGPIYTIAFEIRLVCRIGPVFLNEDMVLKGNIHHILFFGVYHPSQDEDMYIKQPFQRGEHTPRILHIHDQMVIPDYAWLCRAYRFADLEIYH